MIKLWMALRKVQVAQILRLTSENKFVFHLNMNVQDIFKLVLFFHSYSDKFGKPILIYS